MDIAYTTADPGSLDLLDSGLALPADPTTDWRSFVPAESGIGERVGGALANLIEAVGRQLPGLIAPETRPVYRTMAPTAPAITPMGLLLIGGLAYIIFRRR